MTALPRRRPISVAVKATILRRQEMTCAKCGGAFADVRDAEFDHIVARGLGGGDEARNHQALCRPCHRVKTFTKIDGDVARIAKVKRIQERDGLRKRRMNAKDRALQKMMER